MYALASGFYPSMHEYDGSMSVWWSEGRCVPPRVVDVPGFALWALLLLGPLLVWTPLRRTAMGHALLQGRVSTISALPHWLHKSTLGLLATLQNLKWGELTVVLAYLVMHVALMANWAHIELGGTSGWGIALGKGAISNFMVRRKGLCPGAFSRSLLLCHLLDHPSTFDSRRAGVPTLLVQMLFVPVTKTSGLLAFFGIPYERAVKFHRWLASEYSTLQLLHLSFTHMHGWAVVAPIVHMCVRDKRRTAALTPHIHGSLHGHDHEPAPGAGVRAVPELRLQRHGWRRVRGLRDAGLHLLRGDDVLLAGLRAPTRLRGLQVRALPLHRRRRPDHPPRAGILGLCGPSRHHLCYRLALPLAPQCQEGQPCNAGCQAGGDYQGWWDLGRDDT
jgi:hypothetical protein